MNMLTLFGLVLAIGIVVDDAIVVVENVERWVAHGLTPQGGGLPRDGRGHARGHRHRVRALGGLHPRGVHQRDHRAVLPAVRADDCLFHAAFGVQFPHAQPGAGRAAAQAARRAAGLVHARHESRRSAGFSGAFNRAFANTQAGYVRMLRRVVRFSTHDAAGLRRAGGARVFRVPLGADRVHPAAGPGLSHRARPDARCGFDRPHAGRDGEDGGYRHENARASKGSSPSPASRSWPMPIPPPPA